MHGSLLAGRRQRGSRLPGVIRRVAAWMVVVASVGPNIPVEAAGFAPSETVFPATTRIWVSAPDPRRLRENFDNTDYGQLLKDPQMRPFVESVRDQARKAGRQRLGKLGLSFDVGRPILATNDRQPLTVIAAVPIRPPRRAALQA